MSTLYLSRLALNPLRRDVQRDLANCHAMHQRVLTAFPDDPNIHQARERFGVLYRVEPSNGDGSASVVVLVQSNAAPDWSRLPQGYAALSVVKDISASYSALNLETTLVFRLRANPTRRISDRSATQDEHWRGKRVELRREEDQIAWLQRKSSAAGFRVIVVRAKPNVADARVASRSVISGYRPATGQMTFCDVLFEGRLQVTDEDLFRQALERGIGSGKAFGFGLLSVARA